VPSRSAGRLTADDWTAAALEALGEGGLPAVAVEPLAARLGATKGSFYWHFPNRDALVEAALLRWEALHTEQVIRLVEEQSEPRERMGVLLGLVLEAAEAGDPVELAVLATADHPLVAPVLHRVTQRRMDYTIALFRQMGFSPAEAHDRGLLAFSAYLGHAQLVHATPEVVQRPAAAQRRYVQRVLQLLTAR